jgi:peptidoglycan/xylan/chitin deacetylase (PgdA/CDA1 family)
MAKCAYHRGRLASALLRGRRNWEGLRILGYHRLAAPTEPLAVSPEQFRIQMELVCSSGATPIRLDRALEMLSSPIRGRFVCVTFDDGYRDNIEEGEPILRELGIPATIFLPTGITDGQLDYFWYESPPAPLGWEEVRSVAAGGLIDFQSHTESHRLLPGLPPEAALKEFLASKADLERELGSPVTSIAFPAGRYGRREVELVHAAGYRAGVTTDPGLNHGGGEFGSLRRTLIFAHDNRTLFLSKFLGLYD